MIVASLAGWFCLGFKPDTKGLDPSAFQPSGKDSVPASRLVRIIDPAAPRPNVVLILADDLGYGDLGVQGSRDYNPPGTEIRIPTLGTWPRLFHVGRDPGESYDLVKKYPEKAARLSAELEAWRREFLRNPRGWRTAE